MYVVRTADGHLDRLYLPVHLEAAEPALAIVDCGTPRTWLRSTGKGEEWIDDAWRATLGGLRLILPGRRVPPFEESAGPLPVIGAVGNDYLLAGITVLDVANACLTRLRAAGAQPAWDAWPAFHIEVERGMIFLDAELDGVSRRLQLDTGAPACILLRDEGEASDAVGVGRDVLGNPLPMHRSTTAFSLPGGSSRTVPLWKMRSFPHLEAVGTATGQKLEGILGLSALGQKRIVLDAVGGRVLLEP